MEFNIDHWHSTLLMTPYYYRQLKHYVDNGESMKIHLSSYKVMPIIPKGKNQISNNEVTIYDYESNQAKLFFLDNITNAFYQYSNQMVVILACYLEIIIQEFFETLFFNQPERVLSQNETWDTFTKESKIDLIKLSVLKASKGKLCLKLKRIQDECGENITEINGLEKLVEKRNKIVHENVLFDINEEVIEKMAEEIIRLLKFLGSILNNNKIPIIDRGRLVTK